MKNFLVAVLALFCISAPAHATPTPPAGVVTNVIAFGTVADGVTDDGPAFRAAFAVANTLGSDVYVPPGVYAVGRDGSAYYNLLVPPGITVRGAGLSTVIRQLPGMGASVRLLQVNGADTSIMDLVLDGNANLQTVDEHRAGIFITAPGSRIIRVVSQNFTGDGFYMYSGSTGVQILDSTAVDNRRNGITLGGPIDAAVIRGGIYAGNNAQQIDSEPGYPGTVNNVTITGAQIDSGAGDYAITVSGTSSATRSHGWTIAQNIIVGSVFVVWAEDIAVVRNTITSPGPKSCVFVYRTTWNVLIGNNTCAMTEPTGTNSTGGALYPSGVQLTGTGGASQPDDIRVVNNTITSAAPSGIGIRAQACGDVEIIGNTITGSGLTFPYASGIYIRATDVTTPFNSATVVDNTITRHGNRGIDVRGNGIAQLLLLRAVGNTIGDMYTNETIGISPDDGLHPLVHGVYVENTYGPGVTSGRL